MHKNYSYKIEISETIKQRAKKWAQARLKCYQQNVFEIIYIYIYKIRH